MPTFRTLDDIDVSGKRVLVRVDLNVPIKDGKVTDATRIERIAPTLEALAEAPSIVIVLAHFGRPKGKVVAGMSLGPVAEPLAAAIGHAVTFVSTDWRDDKAAAAVAKANPGDVLLLENTRFHPGEEANEDAFAQKLAGLGDIYVNDAFSAAHRAHASTEGVARLLPSAAGRAMQAELQALEAALENPKRPLVAVVGGAKVSTKLELLGNLTNIADTLIIGGGMANTFLAAQGIDVGKSLCEHDMLDTARKVLTGASSSGCKILLPSDAVVAREFTAGAENRICPVEDIAEDEMMLDVGPQSIAAVTAVFDAAATIVWNGPLGAFEITPFDAATVAAARHAASLSKARKLVTVAGGGDTVAALNHAGVADDFTYVSTAGGAFLEWLEGKQLPGVKVLQNDTPS
jgi:phosphoglycerate kinase